MTTDHGDSPDIRTWFGLSYCNHLVLHRVLLQSMPDSWQRRLTALLQEMETAFDHVPMAPAYKVEAAEEHELQELTPEQLAPEGITVADGDPDGDDRTYTNGDGREMSPCERVLIVVPDPVPHYRHHRVLRADEPADGK